MKSFSKKTRNKHTDIPGSLECGPTNSAQSIPHNLHFVVVLAWIADSSWNSFKTFSTLRMNSTKGSGPEPLFWSAAFAETAGRVDGQTVITIAGIQFPSALNWNSPLLRFLLNPIDFCYAHSLDGNFNFCSSPCTDVLSCLMLWYIIYFFSNF